MEITSDLQQYDRIQGDVVVNGGARLHVHGSVAGRLTVRRGGIAQVNGEIGELVVERGGYVNLHGTCISSVTNEGELTVVGTVRGQIRTGDNAKTTVVPGAMISGERQ